MTVKQANQELQLMTWPQKDAMYNIVFVNSAGRDDETQFDIHGEKTLEAVKRRWKRLPRNSVRSLQTSAMRMGLQKILCRAFTMLARLSK